MKIRKANTGTLVVMTIFFFIGILGGIKTVFATIELSQDGPYYAVNDAGNLIIQVEGTLIRVSLSSCEFKVAIPENFEITTLPDETPVIDLESEGKPVKQKEIGASFELEFGINTHGSTLLPVTYDLEITLPTKTVVNSITPKWREEDPKDTGGGGAGITARYDPYITSFYAYDSNKGDTEHVRTYIYNPSPFVEKDVSWLKYRITSYDYPSHWPMENPGWAEWTPLYSEYGYVGPYQTWVVHDYLANVFTASSKWFALNTGTYKVVNVHAEGAGMGGFWSDEYTPSTSQGEFLVQTPSNWHPVFVLSLTSSHWRTTYGHDSAYYIDQASSRFETMFNIELIPAVELTLSPLSTWTTNILLTKSRETAGDLLGINKIWDYSTDGTDKWNHGFDLLAAFTGYFSDHCGRSRYNFLVYTRGNNWGNIPYTTVFSDNLDNVFQHEISHNFNAQDRSDFVWVGSPLYMYIFLPNVMSKPTGFLSRTDWNSEDQDLIDNNNGIFDEIQNP
jgi:hypothetical protein